VFSSLREERSDEVKGVNERQIDSLVGFRLVHLLTMHHQTTGGIQLSRTMVAFEMLCFLMLQQDYEQARTYQHNLPACVSGIVLPFSSSNSLSQYQHHGLMT
jgi:hypothetical protein